MFWTTCCSRSSVKSAVCAMQETICATPRQNEVFAKDLIYDQTQRKMTILTTCSLPQNVHASHLQSLAQIFKLLCSIEGIVLEKKKKNFKKHFYSKTQGQTEAWKFYFATWMQHVTFHKCWTVTGILDEWEKWQIFLRTVTQTGKKLRSV